MTYDPLALQVIRVIRARPARPVAPADGTGVGSENRTGVICETCPLCLKTSINEVGALYSNVEGSITTLVKALAGGSVD